jgi:hypothetical protein
MDMTKFEHEDDPGFVAVAAELRCWSEESEGAENTRKQHRYSRWEHQPGSPPRLLHI